MNFDLDTIEQLRAFKARIVKDSGIWNLFEGVSQAFEKEYMLAQTVSASVTNFDQHGEAFSIKGSVNNSVANSQSYHWLREQGYFEETRRVVDGKNETVIILTDKAISKLTQHYA